MCRELLHSNTIFFCYEGREERLEAREKQRTWSIVPQNALPAGRCILQSNITAFLSIFCFVISTYQEIFKKKPGRYRETDGECISGDNTKWEILSGRAPWFKACNVHFKWPFPYAHALERVFINGLGMHYCLFSSLKTIIEVASCNICCNVEMALYKRRRLNYTP